MVRMQVLSDYESNKLDLRNPDSFRDLEWPIGAQNQAQREAIHAKYVNI